MVASVCTRPSSRFSTMRPPGLEPEERLVLPGLLADQEVERAVGGLELVAAALQLLHALHHPPGRGVVHARRAPARSLSPTARRRARARSAPTSAGSRCSNVRASRVHAGHVHPALVGEGVRPHVGLVRVGRDVAQLVDQVGGLGQAPHCSRPIDSSRASAPAPAGSRRDWRCRSAPRSRSSCPAPGARRSPRPMSAFATPQPASSCVWMPTCMPPSSATTRGVASATWPGSDEPFVSQSVTFSAPASAAARRQRSA